jgi:secretion/DNA translocation related CpaE-like protein
VTTSDQRPVGARSLTAAAVLVSSDGGLVDAVRAIAAEAGVDVLVAADLESAAPMWAEAPLVMVDAAQSLDSRHLLSRRSVVVVARAIPDADTWRALVATGAERIVELPLGAPWLFERMGRSLEVGRGGLTGLVVVTGTAGGAGTSSLAAALARHGAPTGRSSAAPGVLVDLDASGAGLDLMLGGERVTGARWDELAGIRGSVDEHVLIEALPQIDGLAVLSWPASGQVEPDAAAVGHVLDAVTRLPQTAVVDAGRGLGPLPQVALARADACVVLVPLRVRAVASARRVVQQLSSHVQPLVVVRGPAPGGLTSHDVAEALGTDVVAALGDDRRRAVAEEVGSPAPHSQQWRRVCDAILARLPTAP